MQSELLQVQTGLHIKDQYEGMLINQGTKKHDKYQTLGRFPLLTPVQRAFPDPFPRASDITPSLGKVSLPLLGGERHGFGLLVLLPLQLPNGVRSVGGLKTTLCEPEAFVNEFEFSSEHVLLLDELS